MNHEKQNVYLQGLITASNAKRHRQRKAGAANERIRDMAYTYSVKVDNRSDVICQAAFLAIFGINRSRLRKKIVKFDRPSSSDGRGRH